MDLYCPNCREPFDHTHMLEDEPHEWGLSRIELSDLLATGRFAGPADRRMQAARLAGWEFATCSLLSFVRCPSCNEAPALADAAERRANVRVLCELMDDDPDGLIAMRQELG